MITFYQRRATGKSSNLVLQSHSSGLPIAAHSQSHADHLQWLADEVLHITNTSGVSGVYFDKQRNKWVASITLERQKIYIGRFAVKEDAIRARLDKEMELYKEFAPQRSLWEVMNLQ